MWRQSLLLRLSSVHGAANCRAVRYALGIGAELMEPTTYFVWRRSDGYVACTAYMPRDNPPKDSFELLCETQDWGEAAIVIATNRDARHKVLVASWDEKYPDTTRLGEYGG